MEKIKPDFADIVKHFQFEGKFLAVNPNGQGHINDTYSVHFQKGAGKSHRYLLQRINHHIFKKPEEVMQNIEAVTTHLRQKIVADGGNPERETLSIIPTTASKTFYKTPNGNYWRAYIFIEDARTYQTAENLEQIYNAAKSFGKFQTQLYDFPMGRLYETIPNFHHTPTRLEAFVKAVEKDPQGRAQSVKTEIEFVEKRIGDVSILVDLLARGKLPERVAHNDTKLNNVMIDDKSGEGICIIDLDTVMPGLFLYDFGDLVRVAAATAVEDERDLLKTGVDLKAFDRLANGYLSATRDILTPLEIEYLSFSAKLITFETGIRFLTDHLMGDVYFKVHRPDHNLDRTRTQFKMVEDMERKLDRMAKIVDDCAGR